MYIVTLVTCKSPLNKLFSFYSAEINVEIPVIPRRHKTDARNCCGLIRFAALLPNTVPTNQVGNAKQPSSNNRVVYRPSNAKIAVVTIPLTAKMTAMVPRN